MTIICLGCGEDIAEDRVRRLLQSDASKDVLPLWSSHFRDVVNRGGMNVDVSALVKSGGKMCRRCFTAIQRCSKLLNEVKARIQKAANAVCSGAGDVAMDEGVGGVLAIGARGMLGAGDNTSTKSPDVMVSNVNNH